MNRSDTDFWLEQMSDKELWFKSMLHCPACIVVDGKGLELCEFHQAGKRIMLKK